MSVTTTSVCSIPISLRQSHQLLKTRTILEMFCRHMGHSLNLFPQSMQVTKCPHSKRTQSTVLSIQILHKSFSPIFSPSPSKAASGKINDRSFPKTRIFGEYGRGREYQGVRLAGVGVCGQRMQYNNVLC